MELDASKKIADNDDQATREAQVFKKKRDAANKYYEDWEHRFRCKELEDYYEGIHWKNLGDNNDYRPYVINLFFSSIQTKIPSVIFAEPVYSIKPRPWKGDFDPDSAHKAARLAEDTINSFVTDQVNNVVDEFEEIAYDTFFRFGMMEVGYAAEWYLNPVAMKPKVNETTDETDPELIPVTQPKLLPSNERVYIKNINPQTFRIFGTDNRYLERCDMIGYYEWYKPQDILQANGLKNTHLLRAKGVNADALDIDDEGKPKGLLKIWHLWDNREKKRYLVDDETGICIKEFKFDFLNLIGYAPIKQRKKRSFYPIPVSFNWCSPQDEINEVQEALRSHRRKAKRHYIARKGGIEEHELIKILHGGDLSVGYANDPDIANVLFPLPSVPMDSATKDSLLTSKDNFNIISATSSDQRGEADRVTATQAQFVENYSKLRESHERTKYATFLCKVGKLILKTYAEKMIDPFWIQRFSDNQEMVMTEVQEHKATWDQILSEELEGDYDVDVNISSLSPLSAEEEKKGMLEFISVLSNYPEFSMSPTLIRAVADAMGYRNEKVLKEFQTMAMMKMMGMVQAMGGQVPGVAQQNTAKATPNTQEKITNQQAAAGRT